MELTFRIWRQRSASERGGFVSYPLPAASPDMSFLEALDVLNDRLTLAGDEPIAFDHDCREGICGSCGLVINGIAHGRRRLTTVCQLHLRAFKSGQTITVEPFRARAFPVVKDLIIDRSAFDRIVQAGGFVSVPTGSAPDANSIPVAKDTAELAMDAAACIGCGACVAACPNASAMLFVAAKVSHLGLLPQGQPERTERVLKMIAQMDREGFGACTNHGECEAVCPKGIRLEFIARLNRDYLRSSLFSRGKAVGRGGYG